MPIAFPPVKIGPSYNDPGVLFAPPFKVVPAPNLARPGDPLTKFTFHPGLGVLKAVNVRDLGKTFASPELSSTVNPAPKVWQPMANGRVFERVQAILSTLLTGVSRDATGTALGNCRVMVFRTNDNSFVAETVSDGSGNWSVTVVPFTFYLVEYKAGAPDVFGTSPNTLIGIPSGG